MITSAGVGSGIDIESIISQLVELERQPIEQLEVRKNDLDIKISAIGRLKNAMANLSTATDTINDKNVFGAFVGSSSDEDVLTVVTTQASKAEQHEINVLSLATAHQMASQLYTEGENSTVANGIYNFSCGGESFAVDIDGSNNTLIGLRDTINDSTSNSSISASVLNLDGGSRLILTSKQSGVENAIVAPDLFSEIVPPQDATLIIDGFPASSPTNTATNIIPGITLELKTTGLATLNSVRNTDSYKEVLDSFVENYNNLTASIDLMSENELSSDGTLRNIKSDLSATLFEPITIGDQSYSLIQMGLSFDREGTLTVDETRLSNALETDTKAFTQLMTDPEFGFSTRFNSILDKYTSADGLLDNKEDSFDTRKRTLDLQTERMEYRVQQAEARYRRQFSALDVLVSQLQTTSSYLTQQLGSLTSSGES